MSLETYGRYQLLKKLATGGMAQIYLARQRGPEGFEKLLVVKRILPHLAENEDFITMFLDEARIAARLNHPNVVQIFDLGAQDDSFFIAMEYIHGEDVRRVWKQAEKMGAPIPTPLICRIIIEACAGLDYAHKKTDPSGRPLNIVHRDISPQNILVSFEGGVKIVDFGIAKAADQATVTRSGVLKGKYSYMSPEQAGGQHIDSRTDVFAVGVVLYELLTGARLFKRATDIQTLNAVTECRVAPPSEINSRIPTSLGAIVMKALAKDRTQRYGEARQLAAELEAWLLAQGLPSSSASLAEFLHSIYAERLAREQEEGRLMIETADASLADEGDRDKATPSQVGNGKATRTGKSAAGQTRSKREPEATAAERPASRSGPISKPRSLPQLPPALDAEPPRGTEQSLPTQSDGRGGRKLAIAAGVVILLGSAVAGGLYFVGRGPPLVQLTSTPPGATVLEGGKELCRTPCSLASLAEGRHELELRAPGRVTAALSVQVPASGSTTVPNVALESEPEKVAAATVDAGLRAPARVTLLVDSEPGGAAVQVDGAAVGVTPWRGEAPAGARVTLKVEKEGYVAQSESLTVGDGPEEAHRFTLSPQKPQVAVRPVKPLVGKPKEPEVKATGTVRFVVKPWATVECGSYRFGDTPFPDKQLPVGEYRCVFTNPDLGQKSALVKVEANTLVKVPVSF
ncbi:MAG: protein kinase [Myxococcales bacterium]|nr:protein kinase [Myxococcales bacterium]